MKCSLGMQDGYRVWYVTALLGKPSLSQLSWIRLLGHLHILFDMIFDFIRHS
jgi:hypothetical protein